MDGKVLANNLVFFLDFFKEFKKENQFLRYLYDLIKDFCQKKLVLSFKYPKLNVAR